MGEEVREGNQGRPSLSALHVVRHLMEHRRQSNDSILSYLLMTNHTRSFNLPPAIDRCQLANAKARTPESVQNSINVAEVREHASRTLRPATRADDYQVHSSTCKLKLLIITVSLVPVLIRPCKNYMSYHLFSPMNQNVCLSSASSAGLSVIKILSLRIILRCLQSSRCIRMSCSSNRS